MNDNKKPDEKELGATSISCDRVYEGYFSLDKHVIEVDRHEGGTMEVQRLILERGHSVVILAYDPRRDEVLMIDQFSAGAFAAGDKPFGLSLPAGAIDKGEDIVTAARRELKEETSLDAQALSVIHAGAYNSAGSSSERSALVLAIVDMSKAGGVHSAPGENEDGKSVVLKAADFIAQAERGELRDMTSLVAAFQLGRSRLQLRKAFNKAARTKPVRPTLRHSRESRNLPGIRR